MHGTHVLLIFGTLCSVVLASPARRAIGECFPLLGDGQKPLFSHGSLPCTAVPADSVTHGDFKVSTYHWEKVNGNADITDTFGPLAQLHLKDINDGIQKALSTYATFLNTALSVRLVFIPAANLDGEWGDTTYQSNTMPAQRTFSVLIANYIKGLNPDYNNWARTTTHELSHCVLLSTNGEAAIALNQGKLQPFNKWWIEGSADFFGSALFPESLKPSLKMISDPDYPQLNIQGTWQQYEPTESLYNQQYRASLYFLDLWTRPKDRQEFASIWADLASQSVTTEETEEQARLATDDYVPDNFMGFAKRFADDTIKLRRDANLKASVLPDYKMKYHSARVVKIAENGAPFSWTAEKLVSFGFMRLDLSLQAPDTKKKVTYSLALANGASQTTMFYRAKTSKIWTEWDPSKSPSIAVGCGSGPQNYVILVVSTDGKDPGQPQVQVNRVASQKCPCKSTRRGLLSERQESCPIDDGSCPAGTWSLNLDTLEAALKKALGAGSSDATITNLKVGGASTFTYDAAGPSATMSFDDTTISYDGSADEYQFHTDIDIKGSAKGPVVEGEGNSFHWKSVTGSGTYYTATTLKGTGDNAPIDINFPLTSAYTSDIQVQYECDGDTLTLLGLVNGKYFWTYSYTKTSGTT